MKAAGDNLHGKRKRDYRLILAAAFLYGLVDGLLFITMAIYVNRESGSLPMVGFIISLPFLAIFIMSFIWGAISDRLGSYKWVVIVGNIMTGLLFFPMPFLSIFNLFMLRAVQVFFLSVNILAVAMVTEMLPDTTGEAAGTVSLFTSSGWLVGGIASGFVYVYGDMLLLFPVCGIVAIMTGLMLLPLQRLEKLPAIISLKDTFKLEHSRTIGLILTIISITFIGNRAIFTVFPVYLEQVQSLDAIQIGILSASAGLVGAIFVVGIGKFVDRYGRRPMFIIAVLSYMMIWFALVMTDNLPVVIIVWCIPSWAFMTISATAMISDLTTSKERGRGIGALNSAHNLGQFIGALMSGLIASASHLYVPDVIPHDFKGVFIFGTIMLLIPLLMALKVPETLAKGGTERVRLDASEE
jgi:MFS family permease